jgi:hypothetical protein
MSVGDMFHSLLVLRTVYEKDLARHQKLSDDIGQELLRTGNREEAWWQIMANETQGYLQELTQRIYWVEGMLDEVGPQLPKRSRLNKLHCGMVVEINNLPSVYKSMEGCCGKIVFIVLDSSRTKFLVGVELSEREHLFWASPSQLRAYKPQSES